MSLRPKIQKVQRFPAQNLLGILFLVRRCTIAGNAAIHALSKKRCKKKELCRLRRIILLQARNVKDHRWSNTNMSFQNACQQIEDVPPNDLPTLTQQINKQLHILAEAEDVWHEYCAPSDPSINTANVTHSRIGRPDLLANFLLDPRIPGENDALSLAIQIRHLHRSVPVWGRTMSGRSLQQMELVAMTAHDYFGQNPTAKIVMKPDFENGLFELQLLAYRLRPERSVMYALPTTRRAVLSKVHQYVALFGAAPVPCKQTDVPDLLVGNDSDSQCCAAGWGTLEERPDNHGSLGLCYSTCQLRRPHDDFRPLAVIHVWDTNDVTFKRSRLHFLWLEKSHPLDAHQRLATRQIGALEYPTCLRAYLSNSPQPFTFSLLQN